MKTPKKELAKKITAARVSQAAEAKKRRKKLVKKEHAKLRKFLSESMLFDTETNEPRPYTRSEINKIVKKSTLVGIEKRIAHAVRPSDEIYIPPRKPPKPGEKPKPPGRVLVRKTGKWITRAELKRRIAIKDSWREVQVFRDYHGVTTVEARAWLKDVNVNLRRITKQITSMKRNIRDARKKGNKELLKDLLFELKLLQAEYAEARKEKYFI